MKRNITLLINKSEIAAGTRGASLGPEAIMTAARKKSNDFFGRYPIQYAEDENHLLDSPITFHYAKRIKGLITVYKSVAQKVEQILWNDRFPLILAADHASAGGTIAGIKATYPKKRLGVIWIDAHSDIHTPYTTPSGNMHGMPLATALNVDNLEFKRNELDDEVVSLWGELKSIGINGPKIKPEDLVFIGVRDTEKEEDALISKLNITNHTVDTVREKGVEEITKAALDQLKDCDIIYVSFDVDSMNPKDTSYGTGTPVDNGLTPKEAEYFLNELANNEKTVCIEFVEVNPCLDELNKMAEVTFDLLDKTVNALEKN